MGNRFLGGIEDGAMPVLHRYLGNPVLTAIGRLLFHSPSPGFSLRYPCLPQKSYERMDIRSTGMEFASEMVVKASLLQMKVSEVPTTLSPDGRSHPPHLRTWHDGWRHLRFLLMYSPRWLFLYPGIASVVVGLAACLWLLPGPRRVGDVVFDVHTLAYGFGAILVGFQLLFFAVFTKVFAITEGLLPEDPRLNRMFEYIKLETGLVLGATLCCGLESPVHPGAFDLGQKQLRTDHVRKYSSPRHAFRLRTDSRAAGNLQQFFLEHPRAAPPLI